MIEGGSDTVAVFLKSLILAMITHPETQKKAHEELDRVVGTERLPTLNDIPNLPYIRAIISEVSEVLNSDVILLNFVHLDRCSDGVRWPV